MPGLPHFRTSNLSRTALGYSGIFEVFGVCLFIMLILDTSVRGTVEVKAARSEILGINPIVLHTRRIPYWKYDIPHIATFDPITRDPFHQNFSVFQRLMPFQRTAGMISFSQIYMFQPLDDVGCNVGTSSTRNQSRSGHSCWIECDSKWIFMNHGRSRKRELTQFFRCLCFFEP